MNPPENFLKPTPKLSYSGMNEIKTVKKIWCSEDGWILFCIVPRRIAFIIFTDIVIVIGKGNYIFIRIR